MESLNNVPISYTVNVSVSTAPQGLGEQNTNTICLLTNESPLGIDNYKWCANAQDAIQGWGEGSLTAEMVKSIFNPVPNIRTGNGQVLVYYFDGVNATGGTLTTVALTDNIANIKAVNNGELQISVDGESYHLTNLDFNKIEGIDDIVKILKDRGLDCDIEITPNEKIVFKSRNFGTTSGITLTAITSVTGTDLYGSDYFDGANATTVAGTAESGTTLAQAVTEAEQVGYFGGVITTQALTNTGVVAYATSNQSLDHTYYEVITSLTNIAELGASIKTANLNKTRLLACTDGGFEKAKKAIACYMSIAKSANYSGSDTALTMNLKTLTGIEADGNINSSYYNIAKQNGVDVYAYTEGLAVVYSNDNGYYTDDAENLLWIKKAIEVSGFNYLRKTNTKIPQTESGMTGLKQAYEQRCIQGVRNGVIGTGLTWNDSIPFGDPEDFQRSIKENGYYIYSLPVAEQNQAEREQRIAPVVQIAIKLSGAIHSSNVIVTVQR